MIKKDLVRRLYEEHGGMALVELEQYADTFLDLLKNSLSREESLTVAGFGRFIRRQKSGREVLLPDGRRRWVESGAKVRFLPSPALKAQVNAEP